jgi:hypothetical protein
VDRLAGFREVPILADASLIRTADKPIHESAYGGCIVWMNKRPIREVFPLHFTLGPAEDVLRPTAPPLNATVGQPFNDRERRVLDVIYEPLAGALQLFALAFQVGHIARNADEPHDLPGLVT